jgi:hypothetical protein
MLSHLPQAVVAFIAAHPGVAAWIGATVVAIYRSRTAAEWVALGESMPRIQGAIKAARGFGIEPVKFLEGAVQVVTGRVAVDPRDLRIAALDGVIVARDARIAALEAEAARPAEGAPQ